ncbi:MAG: hypothetical protein KBD51_03865 [Candidatus Levybacteria bacterium]|nr:hypothetical protein [Candidatus Levybacteria bacterium]
MKKIFILLFLFLFLFTGNANAIYDPASVPNNKVGVHILFPTELDKAKELVNSNGGDWGYVTIPIQSGDKDLRKWQEFMDNCKKLHLIPLVRLATHGDYFETTTWKKPQDDDIVDFANFLNSLDWPTKNRYIIVYNEVNRADEWQGQANPSEYARILSYAVTVFKSKNQDFFIISSGMDNASVTANGTYNQFDFFSFMNGEVPGIFNQIDGISSHSYPNPGFSQPPDVLTPRSISSYQYELAEIANYSNKELPVFITETGWSQDAVSKELAGKYLIQAFNEVWNDPQVVAVTPFLLTAGGGPFEQFSLTTPSHEKNEVFKELEALPKTLGAPKLSPVRKVLGQEKDGIFPVKNFSHHAVNQIGEGAKAIVKLLFLGF